MVPDMCGLQLHATRKHLGDNGTNLTASFALELLPMCAAAENSGNHVSS